MSSPLENHPQLGCWLKRDDLPEPGTHKVRGLGLQLEHTIERGARGVVVSSSGNAGLAVGYLAREHRVPAIVFLSEKTSPAKIAAVAQHAAVTVVTPRPKNFSRFAAKYTGFTDLRPSRSPIGADGYRPLARELAECPGGGPTSVFVFCNSALTLVGIHEGFKILESLGQVAHIPALHAVQSTRDSTFAEALGAPFRPQREPLAGALGLQVPARLDESVAAVSETGGSLWTVTDTEVREADTSLMRAGVEAAAESAAAFAGFRYAGSRRDLGARPVVLIAGRRRKRGPVASARTVRKIADYAELKHLIDGLGWGR